MKTFAIDKAKVDALRPYNQHPLIPLLSKCFRIDDEVTNEGAFLMDGISLNLEIDLECDGLTEREREVIGATAMRSFYDLETAKKLPPTGFSSAFWFHAWGAWSQSDESYKRFLAQACQIEEEDFHGDK